MDILEEDLIRQSIKGDTSAFRLLVERHQEYGYAIAYRFLWDEEEAREVVQESFLKVWRHLPRFDFSARFSTWFYRIIVNSAHDHLKARNRRQRLLLHERDMLDALSEERPDARFERQEVVERILRCAAKLPDKQRRVFLLRDIHDMSIDEVSETLQMSRGSVKTNLCYARQRIRAMLEGTR